MKLQRFQKSVLLFPLLWLAAKLYQRITYIRNILYDRGVLRSHRSSLPILSVGNIHAGGTGKTPIVRYLVRLLSKSGYSPVILSRGYRSAVKWNDAPVLVGEASTAAAVGDEALELFLTTDCPVVVCPDRVRAVRFVEEHLDANVIVLDDGLQHRRLARSCDLVVVPVDRDRLLEDFLRGRLLPLGMLRESVADATKRASALLLTQRSGGVWGSEQDHQYTETVNQVQARFPNSLPAFELQLASEISGEFGKGREGVRSFENISNTSRVAAFSGIGRPEHFFSYLRSAVSCEVKSVSLSDHEAISPERVEMLLAQFDFVCTTLKDWVKLPTDLRTKVFVLCLNAFCDNEPSLCTLLQTVIEEHYGNISLRNIG